MREVGSFPGILRHNSSPLSSDYSSFLAFQPPNSMLCLCGHMVTFPLYLSLCRFFLFIKGHQSDWIKGPPSFRMTSSTLITSATTLLLNMVTFWDSRKDVCFRVTLCNAGQWVTIILLLQNRIFTWITHPRPEDWFLFILGDFFFYSTLNQSNSTVWDELGSHS